MALIDVTNQVKVEDNDGEHLPLIKCVCGAEYPPWDFIISVYEDLAHGCRCGRKFIFKNNITVWEVKN